jgi:hypothetical protein
MATSPTTLSEPIRVANLPLPADLAAELERHWRSCRFTARERAAVEDDFKLSYHYAGHFVVATSGPGGLQIHAIDLAGPDELDELTKRLHAQGHHNILCLFPTRWDEPRDQIVTLNAES